MRVLIFIFIVLISCQSEDRRLFNNAILPESNSSVWVDTIHYDNRGGIQYRGTWIDKDYGKISDKNTEESEIYYRAWMGGFKIITYVDGHHGGYWINIDGNRTYVDLTEEPRAIKETFSVNNLSYGNHNVTITPTIDSTFVFVKLIKFVAYSPVDTGLPDTIPPVPNDDCVSDTIYLTSDPIHDTIYIDRYYQPKIFIKADSLYLELN